jgi:anaerobic selenocysteine-containing dehydrogenase
VINHSKLGDALTAANRRVRAVIVYNNNPVAVCPDSSKVVEGLRARRPVLRGDGLLPHRHRRLCGHRAAGDYPARAHRHPQVLRPPYVLANNPAIAPVGESLPNAEVFRRLAARMGFDEECFRDSDDDLARQAIGSGHANLAGIDWETLKRERLAAPRAAAELRALRQGRLPHASGKCEFYSER